MTTRQPREVLAEQARRRTHRSAIIVGGVIPVAIVAAAAIVMTSWLPELPDPIAIHWNGAGPDGYGPALLMILMPLAIVVLFSVFAVGAAWRVRESGQPVRTQKLVLVTSVWLSVLLSIGPGSSVAGQRGLTDASQAGDVGPSLLFGVGLGLALAAGAWFLLPAADTTLEMGTRPEPVELTGSERVSWSRTVIINPIVMTVIGFALVLALGATVFTLVVANAGAGFAIASLVLVLLLASTTSYWRVTADRRGLIVRSVLGWPRIYIRAAEIRAVQVVYLNPTGEFGGWGYRWAGQGRTGVIMRAGEAIEVTRNNGKRFVVTVDDAETGAGVLAALIIQRGSSATE